MGAPGRLIALLGALVTLASLAPASPASAFDRVRLVVGPQHIARDSTVAVSYATPARERLRRTGPDTYERSGYVVSLRAAGVRGDCVGAAVRRPDPSFVDLDDLRESVRSDDVLTDRFDPDGAGPDDAQEWCTGPWRGTLALRRDTCTTDDAGLGDCRAGPSQVLRRFGFSVLGRSRPGCRAADSETLASTPAARLYVVGDTAWGCLRDVGRRWRLANGIAEPDGSFGPVRFAGHWAAYAAFPGDPCVRYDVCPDGFVLPAPFFAVADLRTGRRHRFDSLPPDGRAFVLTRTGAAAWVTSGAGADRALDVYDARGFRVVDRGPVVPASLRLAGAELSWRSSGALHRLRLR